MSTANTPLDPDEFDIIAFIEGSNYPEKEVTVYTDGKAALELRELKNSVENSDGKREEKLREQIKKSALTFTLRGLAPKKIEMLMSRMTINSKDISDEERSKRFMESTDALTAATIVKVVTADGRQDARSWDQERATSLRGVLVSSEYEKLAEGVAAVNFDAQLFDETVDAGFSGGRAESE